MVRYRANVAALLVNSDGKLLVCERNGVPGSWQFPQGGVDAGESHEEALYREVWEEVGLEARHYKIKTQRNGYRYLYPSEVRQKKVRKHGNHGQEQTYFLCQLKNGAPEPDVDQHSAEFQDYKWIHPRKFDIRSVPRFKRDVYRAVMRDFFNLKT